MCRLLLVQSDALVNPSSFLRPFAEVCRMSREYQGHGWGVTTLAPDAPGKWNQYHNLTPIWEDDLDQFPLTRTFLAHARSAFRDEDIVLENNMPFVSGRWSYAFNGELRGVRIRAAGRTGAARIWNLIQRAQSSAGLSMPAAVERTVAVLERQSEYLRAVNIFVTDGEQAILHSSYNESPDYFTLHRLTSNDGGLRVAASEPFALPSSESRVLTAEWTPVANRTTLTW